MIIVPVYTSIPHFFYFQLDVLYASHNQTQLNSYKTQFLRHHICKDLKLARMFPHLKSLLILAECSHHDQIILSVAATVMLLSQHLRNSLSHSMWHTGTFIKLLLRHHLKF
jgi:hypothetical protein